MPLVRGFGQLPHAREGEVEIAPSQGMVSDENCCWLIAIEHLMRDHGT